MKIWPLAAAATALALVACMPATAPGPDTAEPPPPQTVPETQAACDTAGGTWRREGMLGRLTCVMPQADAGRSCTDSDQCAGDCRLADDKRPPEGQPATGICQADTSPFGCFTRVEDGRVGPTLCVD